MKKEIPAILLILAILLIGPFIMWLQKEKDTDSVFYQEEVVVVDSVWFEERSIIEDPYQFIRTSDGKTHMCSKPKYHVGDTVIYKFKHRK